MVRSHLDFVQQSIAKLDEKLDKMVAPYAGAITLLCTIPGVDRASAITIISEIGTDMTQFTSSKRYAADFSRMSYDNYFDTEGD